MNDDRNTEEADRAQDPAWLRADLHVHTIHSERPSEWILKTLGTRESYTDPEMVYRSARERGMDLVTVTDHHRLEGALALIERHPGRVFTGVEVSTYFPETRAKIHLLVYGLDQRQLEEINRCREDVYDLRAYLLDSGLAHSVAHATVSVNKRLSYDDLERLILLFDVFEGRNGNIAALHNRTWHDCLKHLSPGHIERLYRKHRIEPASDEPWRKGFTGGSDDHAGLFIGTTYTEAPASDLDSFLECLKRGHTRPGGRHSDFHTLAFSIYKIAWDFTQDRGIRLPQPGIGNLSEMLFARRSVTWLERLSLRRLKSRYNRRNERTRALVMEALDGALLRRDLPIEDRIDRVYDALIQFSDEFFRATIESFVKGLRKLDLINLLRKASSSLFGVLVVLPFLTTLKHLFQDRRILERLQEEFLPHLRACAPRVVWFTDTICDLNGVSVTLQKIGWLAVRGNADLTLVSCLQEGQKCEGLPPNLLVLPHLLEFSPPFYSALSIKIPSVLSSLRQIACLNPEQIIVSTPGPVGLMGVLAARLMAVPLKIVYHSDFSRQIGNLINDEYTNSWVEAYSRWFHNLGDEILVPTQRYLDILASRGYASHKLSLFRRGIDVKEYHFREDGRELLRELTGLSEGVTLLYCGRISRDKNLDFLGSLYRRLLARFPALNLVIAGDGPYLEEYRSSFQGSPRVRFCAAVAQSVLPRLYSGADVFVFPSTIDTFGMAVLEAQACGLPAVVSDAGGPQEIVADGITGLVARADDPQDWDHKLGALIAAAAAGQPSYRAMRRAAAERVREHYNWETLLEGLLGRGGAASAPGPNSRRAAAALEGSRGATPSPSRPAETRTGRRRAPQPLSA